MRVSAWVAILTALCAAGCYSHYAWVDVTAEAGGAASASGDRVATFSEAEQRAAVDIAASVATRLGLQPSWMQKLGLREPTPDYPFRHLALFQGSGEYANLMLTVAVAEDASELNFWVSDLDHGKEMPLVRDLMAELKEAVERAFPGKQLSIGSARKLRLFKG